MGASGCSGLTMDNRFGSLTMLTKMGFTLFVWVSLWSSFAVEATREKLEFGKWGPGKWLLIWRNIPTESLRSSSLQKKPNLSVRQKIEHSFNGMSRTRKEYPLTYNAWEESTVLMLLKKQAKWLVLDKIEKSPSGTWTFRIQSDKWTPAMTLKLVMNVCVYRFQTLGLSWLLEDRSKCLKSGTSSLEEC